MTLQTIFAPLDEPPIEQPSTRVPFKIGETVRVVRHLGWAGSDHVTAIRGEHVGVGPRPAWFHYKDLEHAAEEV